MPKENKQTQEMIDAILLLIRYGDLYPQAYDDDFAQLNKWQQDGFKVRDEGYGYGYGYKKNAAPDPETATKEEIAIYHLDGAFKVLLDKDVNAILPTSIQRVVESLSGYYEYTLRDQLITENKEAKTKVQKSDNGKGDDFSSWEILEQDHPLISRRLMDPFSPR